MPNYASNTLKLASGKSIDKFLSPFLNEDRELDFNKVISLTEGKGGNPIDLWGTKSPTSSDGKFNKAKTRFSFDTAWSPPIPVIQALAKHLPDKEELVLSYMESLGENFCGEFRASNTTSVDKRYKPTESAPAKLLKEVGYINYDEILP